MTFEPLNHKNQCRECLFHILFVLLLPNSKHMSDLQAYAKSIRVIKEAILRSQYRAASLWYRQLCFKELS